ncbi:MAG: aldo/keto reductase [Atopobiaceae bacterium]|jgi:predicted aldo/keto reductase-like oxidoreductase|nr:aldo/keto reductase [Atopobiaceae bacterium]
MLYRDAGTTGESLSLQGLGCMRFTSHAGIIDQAKAETVLSRALERGINYFDTAYTYPGNEACLGRFLAKGNRGRMLVATKLPHYQCASSADFDRIFDEELARLQTDHVDFYLMHMITSLTSWQRVREMGVEDWIARQRASGRIRHVGFSFHGGIADFKQVVDAYPWEFCQIQLNYLDAHAQAGLEGLRYAARRGLPVIIMEPLRGGRLAVGLPEGARRAFAAVDPNLSPAGWGLQWLFDQPEVTCVLSGMNEVSQVDENCDLASRVAAGSLSAEQLAAYDAAIEAIRAVERVGCTGCGYCMPCPHGVDIPSCFRAWNAAASDGWVRGFSDYVMTTSLKAQPANAGKCVGCGRCARRCPQHIAIPQELARVRRGFEGVPYAAVMRFKGLKFKV